MHQLTPIEPGYRISRVMFWSGVVLIAAGVMIWFGVKLALSGGILGWFLLLGAVFCLVSLWVNLHDIRQGRLKDSPLQVVKFVFGSALHGAVLETPEVSISDKTLEVGQEFTILYQQRFNRPVHLSRFTIALVFSEQLRQWVGDFEDVDTVERVVNTYHRALEETAAGPFYDQRSFTIPEDGIPSFTNSLSWLAKHTGKWLVRVHMEPADLPVFMNEYEIFVGPEGASEGSRLLVNDGWWGDNRYRFADKSDH